MDADTERAIEWDCQQVLTRFINYLDARDYAALAHLFAADGEWFRPGGPARGPDGILAALKAGPESGGLTIRHVIYRHEGARNVTAPVLLAGPYMVGLSNNKLVRTADGWRIGEKRTTRIFERTAS